MGKENGSIQSVERAINVLKAFDAERPEWGVNELSRELGLHKSTISRLMNTLESGGLLWQNPETGRYRLGIDLIGLAARVISYLDVREVARPFLRELADHCQETVNLVVLDAGQVVNLDQYVPPDRQVKNIGWVGRRMPSHSTAAGKVLLAFLSPDEVKRVLPAELPAFTFSTITDHDSLAQELAQVRHQGYAMVQEESEEGLNAVAAPILNHRGKVRSAVSVAGPAYRVSPELFPVLVEQVQEAAMEISRRLGYGSLDG